MAHAAMGVELLAVIGDDAGRLLAAMLQGMQAERGQRRGLGMAENAEHAAFLMQVVVIERRWGEGRGAEHRPRLGHGGVGASC